MPTRLTERDQAVVRALYAYRYLTSSQVARLLFPSQQTANRRLRALLQLGFVTYFEVPAVPERIYRLTRQGAELVARQKETPFEELRYWSVNTHAPKDYYFMRHFIAASDFRMALEAACRRAGVEVLFLPEWLAQREGQAIRRHITSRSAWGDVLLKGERELVHTPDAAIVLRWPSGGAALFFLEVDRGTETLSNPRRGVRKMVRSYLSSLHEGDYRRYERFAGGGPLRGFRVLFVTTSERRLENTRERLLDVPAKMRKGLRFLWAAPMEAVTEETVFDKIWCSLDGEDEGRYRIAKKTS